MIYWFNLFHRSCFKWEFSSISWLQNHDDWYRNYFIFLWSPVGLSKRSTTTDWTRKTRNYSKKINNYLHIWYILFFLKSVHLRYDRSYRRNVFFENSRNLLTSFSATCIWRRKSQSKVQQFWRRINATSSTTATTTTVC